MVDVVEAQLGADERRADGMVDVGLAALAALPRRAGWQATTKARVMSVAVEVGVVALDGREQVVEQRPVLVGDLRSERGCSGRSEEVWCLDIVRAIVGTCRRSGRRRPYSAAFE